MLFQWNMTVDACLSSWLSKLEGFDNRCLNCRYPLKHKKAANSPHTVQWNNALTVCTLWRDLVTCAIIATQHLETIKPTVFKDKEERPHDCFMSSVRWQHRAPPGHHLVIRFIKISICCFLIMGKCVGVCPGLHVNLQDSSAHTETW